VPFNFVNGAFFAGWGSLLIGVPILIHLLNRQRYRVVEWAAMEWLLMAIKQNKRRITIEQLILLALRCLIVLLIALAVAKLYWRGFGGPRGGAIVKPRTDWAVVLDDSFTTGQTVKGGTGTCFDRAREEAADLLKKVRDAGPRDSFAVLATELPGRALPAADQMDREAVDRILRRLEHLNPTDLKLRPITLLERGIERLRGSASSNKALVLVTDCRRQDWLFRDTEKEALKTLCDEAAELGITLYLIDVGPQEPRDYANLAVVEIAPSEKSVHARAVTQFVATVENLGPNDATGVPVKFTVSSPVYGDNTLPSQTIDRVPAGQQATTTLFYSFKEPGSYAVTAEIATDRLQADNARHFAVPVTEGIRTLLVDGEPAAKATEAETYALERALRPDPKSTFGVNPLVRDGGSVLPTTIEDADVVFLANVAGLAPNTLKALDRFVREGGGIVLFPGDRVDVARFNQALYDGGKGIAPCALGPPIGDASAAALSGGSFVRFNSDDLDHPLLAFFRGDLSVLFRIPRFYRRFRLELPRDPKALEELGIAVVARYDDDARSPAIVERAIGNGTSILMTSSADNEWNNWPKTMIYPVMMKSLVEYLYRAAGSGQNLAVGGKFVKTLDLTKYDLNVSVQPPKKGAALKRAAQVDEHGAAVVTVDQTTDAGVYTLTLTSRGSAADDRPHVKEYFTANVDVSKSDLRRPEDLYDFRARLARLNITYGRSAAEIWKQAPEERINFWPALLVMLGCVMALESFLGWKFGHHTT
jgi:hypothetical protein